MLEGLASKKKLRRIIVTLVFYQINPMISNIDFTCTGNGKAKVYSDGQGGIRWVYQYGEGKYTLFSERFRHHLFDSPTHM